MIATDKRLHIAAGAAIAAALSVFAPAEAALLVVVLAAFGKELRDMSGRGTPEFADAAYTLAGGILSVAVIAALRGLL